MRNDTSPLGDPNPYEGAHDGFEFEVVLSGDLAVIRIEDPVVSVRFMFPNRFIKDIVEWMECEHEGRPVEHKFFKYDSHEYAGYRQEKSVAGGYERIEINDSDSYDTLEIRKSGDGFSFVVMNGVFTLQVFLDGDDALGKMRDVLEDGGQS